MKLKQLLAFSALGLSVSAPVMAEGLTANVGFATDYVFRGYSKTDESAAIQGGFDFEHETGLHAGVWGSNIDFNNSSDGSLELDVYAGFANEVGGFTYDVGGIYYAYPGSNDDLNYDYWEAYIAGGYDFGAFALSAGFNYSPEFFGDTGDSLYSYAAVDVPLSYEFGLSAHIGRQDIDEAADYTDWSVGVNRNWLELDWGLTYHDTNVDNSNLADDRVVLSVSKSF